MRSGNLKHKITIQTFAAVKDEWGQTIENWVDLKTIYSSITPLSAKEFFKEGVQAEVTHKIEMRYFDGVKPKMQVIYGARVFSITSVIDIREARKTLQLICKEVV